MGGWGTAIMGSYLGQGIKGYNDAELQEEQLARSELQRQAAQEELAAAQETRPLKMQQAQLGLDLEKEKFQSYQNIDKPIAERKAHEAMFDSEFDDMMRKVYATGNYSHVGDLISKHTGIKTTVYETTNEQGKPVLRSENELGNKVDYPNPDALMIQLQYYRDPQQYYKMREQSAAQKRKMDEFSYKEQFKHNLKESESTSEMKNRREKANLLGIDEQHLIMLEDEAKQKGGISESTQVKDKTAIAQGVWNDLTVPDAVKKEKIEERHKWYDDLVKTITGKGTQLPGLGSGSAASVQPQGTSRGPYSASAPTAQQVQTGDSTEDLLWNDLTPAQQQPFIKQAEAMGSKDPLNDAGRAYDGLVLKKRSQQPLRGQQGSSLSVPSGLSGGIDYSRNYQAWGAPSKQQTSGLGVLGTRTADASVTAPVLAQEQPIQTSPKQKVTAGEAVSALEKLLMEASGKLLQRDEQKLGELMNYYASSGNTGQLVDVEGIKNFLSTIFVDVPMAGARKIANLGDAFDEALKGGMQSASKWEIPFTGR